MPVKRKPVTPAALAERTYRKMLALEKRSRDNGADLMDTRKRLDQMYDELHRNDCLTHTRLDGLANLVQLLTDSHTSTYATLVTHCERLLREKETLQKMVDVNHYMARPLDKDWRDKLAADIMNREFLKSGPQWEECSVKHLHRDNVICGICGHNAS